MTDRRPHSRACGIDPHKHGPQCSSDCPTCGGGARGIVLSGAELISRERMRQIQGEGHSRSGDEGRSRELIEAAICYADHAAMMGIYPEELLKQVPREWPWAFALWKPTDNPIRCLEKAGALIAAALDAKRAEQDSADPEPAA